MRPMYEWFLNAATPACLSFGPLFMVIGLKGDERYAYGGALMLSLALLGMYGRLGDRSSKSSESPGSASRS